MKVYQTSERFDFTRSQEPVPGELRHSRRWMPWRYGATRKNGKWEKTPVDHLTGKIADVTDPKTWCSYTEAAKYAEEHRMDGVGFVFAPDDPFCGIDLDDCRDPKSGELDSKALEIVDSLDSYAEISPSGKGVKAIVRATKPGLACRTSHTPWGGSLEVYDSDRFFTVTGNVFLSRPVGDAQSAVERLYGPGGYFPLDRSTNGVTEPSSSLIDNTEINERLEKARSHPTTGKLFRKLYDDGDWEDFPSESEADFYLFKSLAFWMGGDLDAMERAALNSALVRDKWGTTRGAKSYLRYRLEQARDAQTKFYELGYGKVLMNMIRDRVHAIRVGMKESDLRDRKKRVMGIVLDAAASYGRYENERVRFNVDQRFIAEQTGIPQQTVSRLLSQLIDNGWLIRRGKYFPPRNGKPGKSYSYELPSEVPK